jgi:indolepyruvate ferredoxin oxidoreductase beta subunit
MNMKKAEEFNVLLAGVGGQGNLVSSEIIAKAAVDQGFKVKVADVFGAAQRGGSVLSHIRIGDKIYSPIIPQGSANIVVGFEPVECLRAQKYLSNSCIAIVNMRPIYPRDVNIGRLAYPEASTIRSLLKRAIRKLIFEDFTSIAERAGNAKALNVVLVGALVGLSILPFSKETFLRVISETVPIGSEEVNLKAFELGYEEIRHLKTKV